MNCCHQAPQQEPHNLTDKVYAKRIPSITKYSFRSQALINFNTSGDTLATKPSFDALARTADLSLYQPLQDSAFQKTNRGLNLIRQPPLHSPPLVSPQLASSPLVVNAGPKMRSEPGKQLEDLRAEYRQLVQELNWQRNHCPKIIGDLKKNIALQEQQNNKRKQEIEWLRSQLNLTAHQIKYLEGAKGTTVKQISSRA